MTAGHALWRQNSKVWRIFAKDVALALTVFILCGGVWKSANGEEIDYQNVAKSIRDAINETADPCVDFYAFACGNWIAKHPVPDKMARISFAESLQEKIDAQTIALLEDKTSDIFKPVKNIYASCMANYDKPIKSSALMKKIEEFGYSPIFHPGKWSRKRYNLTQLLIQVGRDLPQNAFFRITVDNSMKVIKRRSLSFHPARLGMLYGAYYSNMKYEKHLKAYKVYMREVFTLLAEESGISGRNKTIAKAVESIVHFEKLIASGINSKMYSMDGITTLDVLQEAIGNEINIHQYLRGLMPADVHDYLLSEPTVQLYSPNYYSWLEVWLKTVKKKTLVNYVLWTYIRKWILNMDQRYRDSFNKMFPNPDDMSNQQKCFSNTNYNLPHAVGAMYVRKYFYQPIRDGIRPLLADMSKASIQMLSRASWMDKTTKEKALQKAKSIVFLIGYFDNFHFNDTAIVEYYSDLKVDSVEPYEKVLTKINQWKISREFRSLKKPVDRQFIEQTLLTVSAYFDNVQRVAFLPASRLQNPFFDLRNPLSVNYGRTGMAVGHEMMHGFDLGGSSFDKDGLLMNWWDASTKKKYLRRTECMSEQYSRFSLLNEDGKKLKDDGKKSLMENIADNAGFKAALWAYQIALRRIGGKEKPLPGLEKYTGKQILMLSYAQSWCVNMKPESRDAQMMDGYYSLNSFRVNGVLQNNKKFATEFKCPPESPMNPSKKCVIF